MGVFIVKGQRNVANGVCIFVGLRVFRVIIRIDLIVEKAIIAISTFLNPKVRLLLFTRAFVVVLRRSIEITNRSTRLFLGQTFPIGWDLVTVNVLLFIIIILITRLVDQFNLAVFVTREIVGVVRKCSIQIFFAQFITRKRSCFLLHIAGNRLALLRSLCSVNGHGAVLEDVEVVRLFVAARLRSFSSLFFFFFFFLDRPY